MKPFSLTSTQGLPKMAEKPETSLDFKKLKKLRYATFAKKEP